MGATPEIAVIIPAYNASAYLAETLHAVSEQTVPLECLVVDDGSSDDTVDIATSFAQSDARFRVLSQENGGPVAARSTGVAHTTAPLLIFCDADDLLGPQQLSTMVSALRHTSRAPGAVCSFSGIDEQGDIRDPGSYPQWVSSPVRASGFTLAPSERWSFDAAVTRLCFPPPAGVVVRREAYLAAGGFDPRVTRSEDYDLWVRVAEVGDFIFVPQATFAYRAHGAQRSQTQGRAQGAVRARGRIMKIATSRRRVLQAWHGSAVFYGHLAYQRVRSGLSQRSWSTLRAGLLNCGIVCLVTWWALLALLTPTSRRVARRPRAHAA